jgi:hypothetical protein
MYRFINYTKIFEQDQTMQSTPAQVTAPKEVKSIDVDITEAQITGESTDPQNPSLSKAIEINSIFAIPATKITYTDKTSDDNGMLYIAIKPLGGEQSAANTEMLTKLQAAAAGGSLILMYEAEVSADTNKLSSILDLSGDSLGSLTTVIFDANKEKTKQVSITFRKADAAEENEVAPEETTTSTPTEPAQSTIAASAAEIAAETGITPTSPVGEQVGANPMGAPKAIKSFDDFVGEAKKNSGQWIKDLDMKKGALRKEMKKGKGEKISAKDLAKSEAKLKKKDKDKKKPGLQLDAKDAKTHKRNVLAKNLMKASGAMHESRNEQIKGAKDQLIKIHEVIEKMIKQTSRKK